MTEKNEDQAAEFRASLAQREGDVLVCGPEDFPDANSPFENEMLLRTLFDNAPDAIVMLDVESGRFLNVNRMAETLFGYSRAKLLEMGPFDLSPASQPGGCSGELGRQRIMQAVEEGMVRFEWWHLNARGERFPCNVHLVRVPWGSRIVLRGSIVETRDNKLLELSEVGHSKILEKMAAGASLSQMLRDLVLTIERLLPGMRCSVLLFDEPTQTLRAGAAPSLPDYYNSAVDGLPIGPQVGSCGAAAFGKQRFVVEDVLDHTNWTPFRELALQVGFRACWSEPILTPEDELLGTFAMYYNEASKPAAVEVRVIETAAQIAATAIERVRAQRFLEESNEILQRRVARETQHLREANEKLLASAQEQRLAAVAFNVYDAILITDHNGVILRVNQSFTELTGYTGEDVVGQTPRVLRSGRHPPEFYDEMWRAITREGKWAGEVWNRRKDGTEYPQRLTISCVRDESGKITHYVANGQDLTREKQAEAVRAEILAASSVQRAMLPSSDPQVPGFDIAGAVFPAELVSGDFYNYFPLGKDCIGLLVADVSGHGLGPGLLMSQAQVHLRSQTESCHDPAQLLNRTNRVLSWSDSGHFVTMFLGRLDTAARTFVHAGAGHQGYLLKANGDDHVFASAGVPLGIRDEWDLPSSAPVPLHPGDILVLPTDGIEEAMNPARVQFGRERMFEVVRRHADRPAQDIVQQLYQAARDFVEGAVQEDDISMIVAKVLDPPQPNPAPPSPNA